MQVPSLGILTNGRDWKVAKYDHEKGRLFESKTISSHLLQGSKASEAQAVIKPILQHLVAILREQIAAFEAFKEQHAQWLVDQGTNTLPSGLYEYWLDVYQRAIAQMSVDGKSGSGVEIDNSGNLSDFQLGTCPISKDNTNSRRKEA